MFLFFPEIYTGVLQSVGYIESDVTSNSHPHFTPGVGAGPHGSATFSFLRSVHTALHRGWTGLHPASGARGSLFTSSPALVVCGLFDDGHSDRCEVISHCGFDLHFSDE